MTGNKESIVEKIQKLLNTTTEKGATEAEAQNAMLMAQKLMAKNGLDMADIEANTESAETKKEVMEGFGTDAIKLAWWHKQLANIIADNFRCYNFQRTYGGVSKIVFLGLKADVEIAKSIFKFATIQIEHHAKQYRRARRKELDNKLPKEFRESDFDEMVKLAEQYGVSSYVINGIFGRYSSEAQRKKQLTTAVKEVLGLTIDGAAIRNDFIRGFLVGLKEKFREQIEVNKAEWGLVLVKDGAVVERYNSMKFTTARASSVSTNHDNGAYTAGKKQGKAFNQVSGELK